MVKTSALLALCVCAAVAAGAAADEWILDSVLEGELGTLDLHTEVAFDGEVYHYVYELTATAIIEPVLVFDVFNPHGLGFMNAGNEGADVDFTDPEWQDEPTDVTWYDGMLCQGGVALFYYDSLHGPGDGFAGVGGGMFGAEGPTLGMVPEPAWLSLLGLAGAALAAFRSRRR